MTYIILNIYNNNGIYNIEVKNKEGQKMYIKTSHKEDYYEIGNYVEIQKQAGKYQIIQKVNKPEDFLEYYNKGNYTYQQLYDELKTYYDSLTKEEYKIILDETVFKELDFFKYPAAKSIHHAYIGGLAEHTLSMLKLSENVIKMYNLDKELLWMGIILHDYSKINEMSHLGLNYTIEGNLIGHIVMTVEEIVKICVKYNIDNDLNIIVLKHLILSHHSKLEYGSPKEPMTKEAYVLGQLDEMDSKLNILDTNFVNVNKNEMTSPINVFDKRRFLNYQNEDQND